MLTIRILPIVFFTLLLSFPFMIEPYFSYLCSFFHVKSFLISPIDHALSQLTQRTPESLSGIKAISCNKMHIAWFLLSGDGENMQLSLFRHFHFAKTSISLTHQVPSSYSGSWIWHVSIYAPESNHSNLYCKQALNT